MGFERDLKKAIKGRKLTTIMELLKSNHIRISATKLGKKTLLEYAKDYAKKLGEEYEKKLKKGLSAEDLIKEDEKKAKSAQIANFLEAEMQLQEVEMQLQEAIIADDVDKLYDLIINQYKMDDTQIDEFRTRNSYHIQCLSKVGRLFDDFKILPELKKYIEQKNVLEFFRLSGLFWNILPFKNTLRKFARTEYARSKAITAEEQFAMDNIIKMIDRAEDLCYLRALERELNIGRAFQEDSIIKFVNLLNDEKAVRILVDFREFLDCRCTVPIIRILLRIMPELADKGKDYIHDCFDILTKHFGDTCLNVNAIFCENSPLNKIYHLLPLINKLCPVSVKAPVRTSSRARGPAAASVPKGTPRKTAPDRTPASYKEAPKAARETKLAVNIREFEIATDKLMRVLRHANYESTLPAEKGVKSPDMTTIPNITTLNWRIALNRELNKLNEDGLKTIDEFSNSLMGSSESPLYRSFPIYQKWAKKLGALKEIQKMAMSYMDKFKEELDSVMNEYKNARLELANECQRALERRNIECPRPSQEEVAAQAEAQLRINNLRSYAEIPYNCILLHSFGEIRDIDNINTEEIGEYLSILLRKELSSLEIAKKYDLSHNALIRVQELASSFEESVLEDPEFENPNYDCEKYKGIFIPAILERKLIESLSLYLHIPSIRNFYEKIYLVYCTPEDFFDKANEFYRGCYADCQENPNIGAAFTDYFEAYEKLRVMRRNLAATAPSRSSYMPAPSHTSTLEERINAVNFAIDGLSSTIPVSEKEYEHCKDALKLHPGSETVRNRTEKCGEALLKSRKELSEKVNEKINCLVGFCGGSPEKKQEYTEQIKQTKEALSRNLCETINLLSELCQDNPGKEQEYTVQKLEAKKALTQNLYEIINLLVDLRRDSRDDPEKNQEYTKQRDETRKILAENMCETIVLLVELCKDNPDKKQEYIKQIDETRNTLMHLTQLDLGNRNIVLTALRAAGQELGTTYQGPGRS